MLVTRGKMTSSPQQMLERGDGKWAGCHSRMVLLEGGAPDLPCGWGFCSVLLLLSAEQSFLPGCVP